MKEFGLQAVVLEPGPAMMYLTGRALGKSERTFAVVLPAKGDPVWVLPGFEEMRARELIQAGDDIRVWQEDESPYQRIAGSEGSRRRVWDASASTKPRASSSSTACASSRPAPNWTTWARSRRSRRRASI